MITNVDLLDSIRKKFICHQRETIWFKQTEISIIKEIEKLHGSGKSEVLTLGEVGNLNFPYFKMGNIDSIKIKSPYNSLIQMISLKSIGLVD